MVSRALVDFFWEVCGEDFHYYFFVCQVIGGFESFVELLSNWVHCPCDFIMAPRKRVNQGEISMKEELEAFKHEVFDEMQQRMDTKLLCR